MDDTKFVLALGRLPPTLFSNIFSPPLVNEPPQYVAEEDLENLRFGGVHFELAKSIKRVGLTLCRSSDTLMPPVTSNKLLLIVTVGVVPTPKAILSTSLLAAAL